MKQPTVSQADIDEMYVEFRRETPQIAKAVLKMAKTTKGLSDLGTKQAIAQLVADS